jgi:hypothetical protein
VEIFCDGVNLRDWAADNKYFDTKNLQHWLFNFPSSVWSIHYKTMRYFYRYTSKIKSAILPIIGILITYGILLIIGCNVGDVRNLRGMPVVVIALAFSIIAAVSIIGLFSFLRQKLQASEISWFRAIFISSLVSGGFFLVNLLSKFFCN